ncbi:hypothetical protein CROQUDRAFT_655407 [Cronartium quercuum f. sp. fusiforme G11]|uniref:Uncharacterized protein n=1 Tax=Cronartium quercuum f. sp. fusiforme G11 TaxID=708437 RepID=A0A9P6NPV6_9BASI|nr:hypothetical protein CROQUDRAFT_655407 [Cronartium quercuum f. sp. fusiforme G11]
MPRQASHRKRPRSLALKSRSPQFYSYAPLPALVTAPVFASSSNDPAKEVAQAELCTLKKLPPSHKQAADLGSLKSAIKSPPLFFSSSPTNLDIDSVGTLSPRTLKLTSTYTPPATPTFACRKNVHFTGSGENAETVMLTVYLTYSSQTYDRSPIAVDRSLRIPPRSREPSVEEDETEGIDGDRSDSESDDKFEFDAAISASVLDGF